MGQLLQDYQKYVESDTEVIVIGPESAEEFAKWWREHKMPFVGIPDPNHNTLNFTIKNSGFFTAVGYRLWL